MGQAVLLIVDDEAGVRESLRLIFGKDFRICEATGCEEAIGKVKEEKPEVILLDILMPGADGLETLKRMKDVHPDGQVIMLTALNTARTAFAARETGAFDYVIKPFDVNELRLRVDRALEKTRLSREVARLQQDLGRRFGIQNIVGKSKSILEIFRIVSVVASKKSTVLITGESGTGKELIARAIHFNSDRANKPFVVVNCAALPDALIESELFGYERGAFTNAYQRKMGHFDSAHGGTLFLDEIGELGVGTQAKLLRAIETESFMRLGGTEESKVDVRIIAASNRELEKLVKDGGFRPDLFYRLNVVSLHLPPLRERQEDVPLLVEHFLRIKACENSCKPKNLSAEVIDYLLSYSWPGNVRELENLIERLTILVSQDVVGVENLPEAIRQRDAVASVRERVLNGSLSLSDAVDEFERELIVKALEKAGHNQTRAASLLGTSRRILRYRMEKLNIIERSHAAG
ncbi:MAG: sigma-54-dependent Fis family transcriptional regulator [Deltaproteobacteria bacterium]|nr:sigma-54-dependent Fis family transcriptional regulator [Deltaproteobacteria bacterium]